MVEKEKIEADAVLEGGGVKGVGLAGALAVAEDKDYIWKNVAGTSAGAIAAAAIAVGYNAKEIKKFMDELDYNKFKDQGLFGDRRFIGTAEKAFNLIFKKGIYKGDWFENWMRERLEDKKITTFGQLVNEKATDERYRFKLRVIASDISRGRMLILPQDIKDFGTEPEDLDIADAVRMSMSIPFFYQPVKRPMKGTSGINYILDGGVLSNFPVWLFDVQGKPPSRPTFGFKLVEPAELSGVNLICPYDDEEYSTFEMFKAHLGYMHPDEKDFEIGCPFIEEECQDKIFTSLGELKTHCDDKHRRHKINNLIDMGKALFSTITGAHDAQYIKDSDFIRTIAIPTLDVKTTDFDLNDDKKKRLYESGRAAAERFLKTWNFKEYVKEYRSGKERAQRSERLRA